MVTKSKVRTTIELNPGDKERLAQVAADLGIYQTTGAGRGTGSISGLMQYIAAGHLEVIGYPPANRREGEYTTTDTIDLMHVIHILEQEDVRLTDGRWSDGFVSSTALYAAIDRGLVEVYEAEGLKFVRLIKES